MHYIIAIYICGAAYHNAHNRIHNAGLYTEWNMEM